MKSDFIVLGKMKLYRCFAKNAYRGCFMVGHFRIEKTQEVLCFLRNSKESYPRRVLINCDQNLIFLLILSATFCFA